jgi:hypothetical protein
MTKKKVSKHLELSEAVFLVMCDPSMNELWATYTGLCIGRYGSRWLTARSWMSRTRLKIQPLVSLSLSN